MQKLTSLHVDFVASHLRHSITKLQNIHDFVEKESFSGDEYVVENLKDVETTLKQLRKLYRGF